MVPMSIPDDLARRLSDTRPANALTVDELDATTRAFAVLVNLASSGLANFVPRLYSRAASHLPVASHPRVSPLHSRLAPLTPPAADQLLPLLEDPRLTLRTEASLLGTLCIDVGSPHTLLEAMEEAYVVRTNRTTGARLIGLARRN